MSKPTSVSTPQAVDLSKLPLENLISEILRRIGDDPTRPGLRKTPIRVASSLQELTSGYGSDPKMILEEAIFQEDVHDLVLVKDIEFYSLCEHHLLPFYGRAHVAYLPNGFVVGLSKIPRLVDIFSKRLQLQERIGQQIAQTLWSVLSPHGVAVLLEANHLCMQMRGVAKPRSQTFTLSTQGCFKTDEQKREEFLRLCSKFLDPVQEIEFSEKTGQ